MLEEMIDLKHDTNSDECWCGPTSIPVECDDGSISWVLVHHRLDGKT